MAHEVRGGALRLPPAEDSERRLSEDGPWQASLQHAQKMAAVGELASSVAHDFVNMLAAVRGSVAAIAKRAEVDPDILPDLEVISDATERAGRLARQLLGFAQDRPVVRVLTSVNDLILDLAPMLERLGGERVTFDLRLDPDIEMVSIERASFEQVLVNLVVNARDAISSTGTVTIATRHAPFDAGALPSGATTSVHHVVVEVSDTGRGISPEHLSRIFDPFFTTKPPGAGLGIGLTTAYAFAERSDGHIDVASEAGRGTTFRLYFPAVDHDSSTEPRPRAEAPPAPPASGSFPTSGRSAWKKK